jgi:Tfp pilus assembly protein PilF
MTSKFALPLAFAILLTAIWTGALLLGDYLSKDFVRGPLTKAASNSPLLSPELQALTKSIKENPNDASLRLRTAAKLLSDAQGQPSAPHVMQAIDHLRHVLELEPRNSKALRLLADVSFNFGVFDKAAQYYLRYLDIEPNDSKATIDYSLSLIQMGQSDLAISTLTALHQKEPESYPAHLSLALAYKTNNQPELAKKMAESAVHLAPNDEGRQAAERFIDELRAGSVAETAVHQSNPNTP